MCSLQAPILMAYLSQRQRKTTKRRRLNCSSIGRRMLFLPPENSCGQASSHGRWSITSLRLGTTWSRENDQRPSEMQWFSGRTRFQMELFYPVRTQIGLHLLLMNASWTPGHSQRLTSRKLELNLLRLANILAGTPVRQRHLCHSLSSCRTWESRQSSFRSNW